MAYNVVLNAARFSLFSSLEERTGPVAAGFVAGGLAELASKHQDNRLLIAKRLVGLLVSSNVRTSDRAERVLMTCSSFTSDSAANQVAIAK